MWQNFTTANSGSEKINRKQRRTDRNVTKIPARAVKIRETTTSADTVRKNVNTRKGINTGRVMNPDSVKTTGCCWAHFTQHENLLAAPLCWSHFSACFARRLIALSALVAMAAQSTIKKKQVQVMSNPLHWKQRLVPLYLRSALVYSMKKLCKHNILFFLNILLWLFRKINWIKRISQAMQGQYRSSLLEGLVKFKEWKIFKESFSSRQREFPLSQGLQLKKWPS